MDNRLDAASLYLWVACVSALSIPAFHLSDMSAIILIELLHADLTGIDMRDAAMVLIMHFGWNVICISVLILLFWRAEWYFRASMGVKRAILLFAVACFTAYVLNPYLALLV